MINKEELLFTVDESNVPATPKPRQEVHANGYWHRTTHIWVLNNKKEVLCQKRSLLKDMNPGRWEPFFGGHILANQDYKDSAIQELHEELGILTSKEKLHFFDIHKSFSAKEFQAIFYYFSNIDISTLILEKEEVDQVKWVDLNQLNKLLHGSEKDNWSTWGYESRILLTLLEK